MAEKVAVNAIDFRGERFKLVCHLAEVEVEHRAAVLGRRWRECFESLVCLDRRHLGP